MIEPVKFTVGTAISTSVRIWLANLLPFSAIALVLNLPMIIWCFVATGNKDPVQWMAAVQLYQWVAMGAMFIVGGLISAAVAHGTWLQLRGTRISIIESLKVALASTITVLIVVVLAGVATGVAAIALLVPGILVWLNYYVAIPVAVTEKLGALNAMRRSQALTHGYRKQIFAAALFVTALSIGCSYLLNEFIGLNNTFGTTTTEAMQTSNAALMSKIHTWLPITTTFGALLMTLTSVLPAVVYAQLRQAKEPEHVLATATARVV
ncbi:MAG: hypothetical protein KBG15_16135 [Kofleriaceae bacterium]|nr:hypothetical protein [Kofleriaceae bacterium]